MCARVWKRGPCGLTCALEKSGKCFDSQLSRAVLFQLIAISGRALKAFCASGLSVADRCSGRLCLYKGAPALPLSRVVCSFAARRFPFPRHFCPRTTCSGKTQPAFLRAQIENIYGEPLWRRLRRRLHSTTARILAIARRALAAERYVTNTGGQPSAILLVLPAKSTKENDQNGCRPKQGGHKESVARYARLQ